MNKHGQMRINHTHIHKFRIFFTGDLYMIMASFAHNSKYGMFSLNKNAWQQNV